MTKPSILIVPGAFGLPDFYDLIVGQIRALGHDIRALKLPSVSATPVPPEGPLPTIYDDAAAVAEAAEKLADEGKDVILFAHSYGGVVTSQSTKGLSKAERQKQGKKGGIVRLAFMTTLVPDIGVSAGSLLADVPPELKLDLKPDVRFPASLVCSPN